MLKLSTTPHTLSIEWANGRTSEFSSHWLRDNCPGDRDRSNGQRLVEDELLGRGASLTIRDPVHRATPLDHARWAARTWPSPERVDVVRVLEAATSAGR